MKKWITPLASVILLCMSNNAIAEANRYHIDPAHTNILVNVSHLGFSDMTIEALQPEGKLVFNPDKPQESKIDIVMKAANIDGDDEKFNQHLQSADFFNVAQYPDITFTSTKIDVTGERTAQVTGDLTLLGVTKPLTLDVTFNKAGVNPFSEKETVGFTAHGHLQRSEFGMNYGLPGIGDEVSIIINLEAVQSPNDK